jgi:uncharacterized membrane protein HdeD (DUF308 family)
MVKHGSTLSVVWGVLLVLFGIFAIAEPFLAAVALNVFVAWLLILAGVVHIAVGFHSHSGTSLGWKLLIGVAYIFIGGYLLFHPLLGVASLTLLLAILFLLEGVLDVILWWKMRSTNGAIWFLIDGIVTLFLGGLIYAHWPSSSVWALGTLVGVSMIMSGVARIMLSLSVRHVASRLEKRAA